MNMNREIGLESEIVDLPMYEAQNRYTVSAMELIEKFETRVTVESSDHRLNGILWPSHSRQRKQVPRDSTLPYNPRQHYLL